MNFPAIMHIPVKSEKECTFILDALQAAIADEGTESSQALATIVDDITYSDGSGGHHDLPEAWLEVGGKRLAEGRRSDMNKRFDTEVNTHRASVILYARNPGESLYRQVRVRSTNNMGV